jgi:membrane protein DedA with SNARE-associated domain
MVSRLARNHCPVDLLVDQSPDGLAPSAASQKESILNLFIPTIQHLLATYGPWAVSIFLFSGIENMAIPVAGEPFLLAAAIAAGTTHDLSAFLFVSFASLAGSAVGSSIAFWIGRTGGFRVLYRCGHLIRFNESKLKVGMYLFHRYGGRMALLGRCMPLVRGYMPFLAGTYQMRWLNFILANALGAVIMIAIFGSGGYVLGNTMQGFVWMIPIVAILAVLTLFTPLFLQFRRYQRQWEKQAEELFPGPRKEYHLRSRRETSSQNNDTNERDLMMQTRSDGPRANESQQQIGDPDKHPVFPSPTLL